jgi:predicted DNA-binding transcriptional regulator AlpA
MFSPEVNMVEKELLTQNEVSVILGINRTTLWKLQKEDAAFPKPIMILTQKKWKRTEIDAYLNRTGKDGGKEE